MVRRISSSPKGGMVSRGVPLMGCSRFSGMEDMSSDLSVKASSARCRMFSPMPMIPPQQTSIPTGVRRAKFLFSLLVYGWNRAGRRMKGLFPDYNGNGLPLPGVVLSNCPSEASPNETHRLMWVCLLRYARCSHHVSTSRSVGFFPLATKEKRRIPAFSFIRA